MINIQWLRSRLRSAVPATTEKRVWLIDFDNEMQDVRCLSTLAGIGYYANWKSYFPVILFADGKTSRSLGKVSGGMRWLPHSGWTDEELKKCGMGEKDEKELAKILTDCLAAWN